MSRSYITIGAGWLRQGKDGSEYISCVAGDKRNNTKLYAEVNGVMTPVESFALFFQDKDESHPKSPDLRVVFSQEN